MKKSQLIIAVLSVLGLAACGSEPVTGIEAPESSESVCVADAECTEGLVCQDGSCIEVIAPEVPEAPEPEPEPDPLPEAQPEAPSQPCLTDADCQDGYVCALGQCVKPDPIPHEAWM